MSFQADMDKAVRNAIHEVFAKHSKMAVGFIGIARGIDSEGEGLSVLFFPAHQPIYDSLGLTSYLSILIESQAGWATQVGTTDTMGDAEED